MGRISPDSDIGKELIAETDILVDTSGGGDVFIGGAAAVRREDTPDEAVIVIDTPKGPLVRRVRRTAITSATVEFPFRAREDVEKFLSIPYLPPRIELASYHAWRDRIGDQGLVLVAIGNGACLPADYFSPEDFCLAWAEAPDLVTRLVETATERLIAYVERLCQAGVDAFRIVGGEYVSVQLGPRAFRELVTPFDSRLVAAIHRGGAIAYYHNHGRVMSYLPAHAALGIDALDPLEAPPWGDVGDLAAARAAAGDRLCLVGNLDDMEVIDSMPEADVVALARERARAAGPSGFILGGTASGTYGERAARNFIAMAHMVAGL
jgi:hypothetical protein